MGRRKIDIKKIEETSARKITFSKRFPGLMKKAYEISVLSNSDVVLIIRHPSKNNLCYFSHSEGVEDILIRFLNMPDDVRKVNGREFSERLVIPNKDSLIAKLENCKIQDTFAAQEISIEQENSRAITSGDDNRSIQHTELINPQEFPQQILGYHRFYQTASPMTPEHLFDDYGDKLTVILSHIQQRKMLLQQQELMETNALFANLQLQQQATINTSLQFYQNNGHINPKGEQYFNKIELPTGLIKPQVTAPNNSWVPTDTARPSNYYRKGMKQETQQPRLSLKELGAYERSYSAMYPPSVPCQFPPRPHDHEASGSQSHDFKTQATETFFTALSPATYPDNMSTIGRCLPGTGIQPHDFRTKITRSFLFMLGNVVLFRLIVVFLVFGF